MLFNSVDFVVFFAFVISLVVIVRNRNFSLVFLIAASYLFFYFSNNFLITLLVFSTILDYFVGKEIWKTKDKSKKKGENVVRNTSKIRQISTVERLKS